MTSAAARAARAAPVPGEDEARERTLAGRRCRVRRSASRLGARACRCAPAWSPSRSLAVALAVLSPPGRAVHRLAARRDRRRARRSRRSSRCRRRAARRGRPRRRVGGLRRTARSGGSATTARRRGRRSAASSSPRARTSWPRSSPTAPCAGRSRGRPSRSRAGAARETDTRIAYLARPRLHVVAGDGTGDADLGLPPAAPRRSGLAAGGRGARPAARLRRHERPRPCLRARLAHQPVRRTPPGPVPSRSPGRATDGGCSWCRRGGCASTTSTATSSSRCAHPTGARRRRLPARDAARRAPSQDARRNERRAARLGPRALPAPRAS